MISSENTDENIGDNSIQHKWSKRDDMRALAQRGYYIGQKISSGTFAKVRYAIKKLNASNKPLAVKIINKKTGSEMFVDKLLPRELALWPELRHRNIIQVMQIVYIFDRIYVFMELAINGSVIEYLQKNGAVGEDLARLWTKGMCEALKYCHRKGIAHRDVKCDNLLLDKNMEIKLGDFGFCKLCVDDDGNKILSSTYCGSAAYVAPEVLKCKPYNPMVADVWSAGVCLYTILNNRTPFDDRSITLLLKRQLRNMWRFAPDVANLLSQEVKQLIRSMMEPHVPFRVNLNQVLSSDWMKLAHRMR